MPRPPVDVMTLRHREAQEIATAFARAGARVVMACRSRERAAAAADEIIRETGNARVEFRELDLARMSSVRAFAEGFNGKGSLLLCILDPSCAHKMSTSTTSSTKTNHQYY